MYLKPWIYSTHACKVLISFIKFCLKLGLIDSPSGRDFTNWALNHVILWVLKCFLENWPKRFEIDALKLDFELEVQIWKFQILDSRSSGVNSCIQHFCCVYSLLELGFARASEDLCHTLERVSSAHRAWFSHIQYFCSPLERESLSSSEDFC